MHYAMKTILLSSTAVFAIGLSVANQAAAGQAEIDAINAEFEAKFEALKNEVSEWQSEAPNFSDFEATLDAAIDVTWELTDFSFDIPEIVFKTREFSLDLPQFKWDRTGFSMDVPETFMGMTKVGEYPCFRGWKWYSCDIKTKIPQVRMVRKDFSLDLPQVWWDRTSFSMDIPEFFSKRVEMKMHLPQFKLESVSSEIAAYEGDGKAFETRAEQLAKAQKEAIKVVVVEDLNAQKAQVRAKFDEAISVLDKAIDDLKAVDADPAQVQTEDGNMNLIALKQELLGKRSAALAEIDTQLERLNS